MEFTEQQKKEADNEYFEARKEYRKAKKRFYDAKVLLRQVNGREYLNLTRSEQRNEHHLLIKTNPEYAQEEFEKNYKKKFNKILKEFCYVWDETQLVNGMPRFGLGAILPIRTIYARRYIWDRETGVELPPNSRIKMYPQCLPLCVNPEHMFVKHIPNPLRSPEAKAAKIAKERAERKAKYAKAHKATKKGTKRARKAN